MQNDVIALADRLALEPDGSHDWLSLEFTFKVGDKIFGHENKIAAAAYKNHVDKTHRCGRRSQDCLHGVYSTDIRLIALIAFLSLLQAQVVIRLPDDVPAAVFARSHHHKRAGIHLCNRPA